ncbi:MAG: Macrolide export ATP-binding/permease protein MacB [bacterium ADurb.Bin212]|nr:MAG: Macrolide export ATP-binding/permease protein MacB [bacterium ADurb.Bin212]
MIAGLIDYLFLVIKQFSARKMRTFLTMLAIGVGVGSMFLLVSFVLGLQDLVLHRIAPVETLSTADISPGNLSYINDSSFEQVAKMPLVNAAVPIIYLSGQASDDGGKAFADISVNATTPDYIKYDGIAVKEGRNFQQGQGECLITRAAIQLFSEPEMLGKYLNIRELIPANSNIANTSIPRVDGEVKVVGVLDNDEVPAVYIDIEKVKNVAPELNLSGIKISISDVSQINNLKEDIGEIGFEADAVYDMVEETSKLFNYIQAGFSLLGVIGLFVATIGMFNTMTISLLERTRDIGYMRAFGVSKQSVRSIFLTESALIGMGGGFLGIVIGLIVSIIINSSFRFLALKVGSEGFDLFIFKWWIILATLIFSILIGLITGIYPAKRASKISPLESIRYE